MSKDGKEERGCAWMIIAAYIAICLFMATCGHVMHVERMDEIEMQKHKITKTQP